MSDQAWADLARSSREALAGLGYAVGPRCLPDEPDACGGTFAQHVTAHLGSIKAVADHHLEHLGKPLTAMSGAIYWEVAEQIDCRKTCPGTGT